MAAFDRALTELPEQYQRVLRLPLVDGLTSGQIARSLGHPPATVCTWLRRGKEVLRRILPSGLTTVALGTVCAGRGLAAVREVVLEYAQGVAPAAGAGVDGAGRPIVGTRVQLLQKLEKDPDPRIVHRIHRHPGTAKATILRSDNTRPKAGRTRSRCEH